MGTAAKLQPEQQELVTSLLRDQYRVYRRLFSDITAILRHRFAAKGLRGVRIECRRKDVAGIAEKMQRKGATINHVTDLFGFRIITDRVEDCDKVLEVLHRLWRPYPERFKDYIRHPKPNGYQSIHTTLHCLDRTAVEFQIRTIAMDHLAQFGSANHALYKAATRTLRPRRARRPVFRS